MVKQIQPGATIGILGGGQLGKMLAQSAQKMGYRVAMYDASPDACGFGVSHRHVVGSYSDHDKVLAFAQSVDVLTYEFENIDGALLEQIADQAYLPQGTKLLLISQQRVQEKTWLNEVGAQTVAFQPVSSLKEYRKAIQTMGYPAILKTTRFGYDGKGQIRIENEDDERKKKTAIESLLAHPCILEDVADFAYEASVMVSRDLYGHVEIFPVSRNQHRHGILYSSLVGGDIPTNILTQMKQMATHIAVSGELIGVCGVEFFVMADGSVYVNEIAPRPHNSGHYSIEAVNVSQYDQHILALVGQPLIQPRLYEPALMINILGQHLPFLADIRAAFPTAMVHLYGKDVAKRQRKMGHFTLTHPRYDTLDTLLHHDVLQQWEARF
ncbi:MAG: 5-(carboxyamino)imidazole ribonucleotide synthase [Aerococcus sp.]|nr:5-(carboxyamino)imidazole ribonucleotide synthase [Aerococcus sp.]